MNDPSTIGTSLFWRTLRIFWGKDHVDKWWTVVFRRSEGVGKPENHITLSPSVHQMHSQGHFAFEPIGLDSERKKLVLQFWWLKAKQSSERVTLSDLPQLSTIYNPREDRFGLHNVCTDKPLRSSDVIVLTTLVIPCGAWFDWVRLYETELSKLLVLALVFSWSIWNLLYGYTVLT